MIEGGYVLKPRKISKSDIANASPCTRETWDYIIREANYKPYKRGKFEIERGQLFRSYEEIIEDLCWYAGWRKETYTKTQMKNTMKFLRDTQRITTKKKPGGVLITVCNYEVYQNPDNYEGTNEQTSEGTKNKPRINQEQTFHNYKKEKNNKKDKNINNNLNVRTSGADDFPDACEFLEEAKRVSEYLLEAIIEYDPTHRYASNPPSIRRWVLAIERAMRLDGRTEKQLQFIIDYVYRKNGKHSGFWAGNIESGQKLRDHFDKIKNQIKTEVENGTSNRTIARNAISQIEKLDFEDA